MKVESKDMLDEDDEDDEDVVGLADVLDCELSVTNAIVATTRTMTTTTTITVAPIPLRLCIKAIRPPKCVLWLLVLCERTACFPLFRHGTRHLDPATSPIYPSNSPSNRSKDSPKLVRQYILTRPKAKSSFTRPCLLSRTTW